MQSMPSLSGPKRQVRFSLLPPSTRSLSFDVLEWIPGSGVPLARLHSRRGASEHCPDGRGFGSFKEGPTHLSDCNAFEASLGSWRCFRTLSCCGDTLVIEDAELVDVGAARRHQFTWQQGPGRLPSGGSTNANYQESVDFWRALVPAFENATDNGSEMVPRDLLFTNWTNERPPRHLHCPRREIPMQDIYSLRRHCFQKPVPLLFDARGQSISQGSRDDTAVGGNDVKRLLPHRRHRRGDDSRMRPNLQWRYELWGPVGVIITLRGGCRMFLAFASAQHAEQLEGLLMSSATGAEISCRQQRCHFSHESRTDASASSSNVPTGSPDNGMPSGGSVGGQLVTRLSSSVVQHSPLQSRAPVRLASCEVSLQGTPATCFSSQAHPVFPLAWAFAGDSLASSTPAEPHQQTAFLSSENSPSRPSATVVESQAVGCASPADARRGSSKPPGSGCLYCRPWGEASRYRRYYFRLCTTTGMSHKVHLSRHRLRLWQRLQRVFGFRKRSVSLDLRHTSVSPSATHENVLCVTSQVESSAEFKLAEPLGGGVALTGPANESIGLRSARRRELELRGDSLIIFEALARSPEERMMWLAWFRSHGAAIKAPIGATRLGDGAGDRPTLETSATFKQLDCEQLIPTPLACSPRQGTVLFNPADHPVPICVTPAFSGEAFPSLKPLAMGSPHLPLKETFEGRRGGFPAVTETAAAPWLSSPSILYPSKGSPSLGKPLPTAGKDVGNQSDTEPPLAAATDFGDRTEEEEELTVVVEDEDCVQSAQWPETTEAYSPLNLTRSDTSKLDDTNAPRCRTAASPLLTEAARRPLSRSGRATEAPNTIAVAKELSKTATTAISKVRTLAATIAAPMYLEDTTSSNASSSGGSKKLQPQPPAMAANSPRASSHSTTAPTPRDGLSDHMQSKEGKVQLAAGDAPLGDTAAAQRAIIAPVPNAEVDNSDPDTPAEATDGGAAPVPISALITTVRTSCVLTAPESGRLSASNSIGTPPRTARLETAVAYSVALESLVAAGSQQMWRPSNTNPPAAAPRIFAPSALQSSMERLTPSSTRSFSPLEAPPKSALGMMSGQLCHWDRAKGADREAHTINDASTLCSPAPSSREKPEKGGRETDDARVSDAFSSRSLLDSGLLPSWSSAVDPRLRQFLEPYIEETDGDQASRYCDSCRRGSDTLIEAALTPFDLHVVPSREHRDGCGASLPVSG
ncbi:hypothetical protein GH5_02749 [Leishmania sp. Ghana 2012 LV757]|uniref:hypothetical protein n=1 Tax=Leishmania sp. Ghana 2012 LV757 TaxID=2803181 RepID=UPI001B64853B|nr:hypothetical protein GH5_02749 [Leishmania sp. Ghana 2012 LV757]